MNFVKKEIKMKKKYFFTAFVCGLVIMTSLASAANKRKLRKNRYRAPETSVELTEKGKRLEATYAKMLSSLKAEIVKQLPKIDRAKQQACLDALAAQKLASIVYEKEHRSWRRGYYWKSVDPAKLQQKLKDAPHRVADAEMLLKNALAMPDGHEDKARAVEEAQKNLGKRKKELESLPGKLLKAKKSLEAAKKKEPQLSKQVEAADRVWQQAKANSRKAYKNLGVEDLLAGDELDAKLAKYMVISEATPYWLAAYAQQGLDQEKNIEQLLADKQLMIEMLVADGPVWEKYGPAVEIYKDIQKASPRANKGLFQRLALAVALEHAVPLRLEMWSTHPEGEKPQYADPIQRYRSYEKAYLAGELDRGFEGLSTWSLRMVVNGTEPDNISAWGRQMLRNYRPDLITMDDYDWRYVKSVNTEINYTSKFQKLGWDRPDLQRYQNILAVGGICGRRAHFGRFILRAFGIPTTARSQPGHAALVHWTPDGWVPCLGGGWGAGNRTIFYRYPTDLDFLAGTQARQDKQAFMKVKRAQWIGCVRGEESKYGYHSNIRGRDLNKFAGKSVNEIEVPDLWQTVAMITQNEIVDDLKANAREAVGEDLGESDESELKDKVEKVEIPESERKITVDSAGTIHISAAACSEPTNNTDVIRFMPSNLGGMQLHYTRYGGADTFAYTFDVPRAGKYQLTARLVTPAPKQHLYLKVNNAGERIDIALPYTIGMWDELKPVEVELKKGKNVLIFYRGHYFQRGVSLRDFKLVPVQ